LPPYRTIDESGLCIRLGRSGGQSPDKWMSVWCHDEVVQMAWSR